MSASYSGFPQLKTCVIHGPNVLLPKKSLEKRLALPSATQHSRRRGCPRAASHRPHSSTRALSGNTVNPANRSSFMISGRNHHQQQDNDSGAGQDNANSSHRQHHYYERHSPQQQQHAPPATSWACRRRRCALATTTTTAIAAAAAAEAAPAAAPIRPACVT